MSWQTTKTTAAYTPAYQLQAGKLPKRCTVQAIRCVGALAGMIGGQAVRNA